MKKIIPILAIAAVSLMLAVMPALGETTTTTPPIEIQATVTVTAVCGLSVDQTSLTFGNLLQGGTSSVLTRSADLTTNTPTTVTIAGVDWVGVNQAHTMSVGQTAYGVDVTPGTALTTSAATLFPSSSVNEQHSVGFQVAIPNPQPADTYSQTITIGFTC